MGFYLVKLRPFLLSLRVKTLSAAVVPVAIGTTLAFVSIGSINKTIMLLTLLAALLIQIATNFINDAKDFKKGADKETRLGPKRMIQSGVYTYEHVMKMAYGCLLLAALLSIPLVLEGGMPILFVGLLSLFFAYGYTGGPFPLAYLGLGDLFVLIFFGFVAVGGTYYLQAGQYDLISFIAGLQAGLLATVLIVINNMRDYKEDKKVNKMTLAARFGLTFSRYEVLFIYVAIFSCSFFWWGQGLKWAAFLPLIAFLLVLRLVVKLFKEEPSSRYNQYLAESSKICIIYSLLFCVGLIIDVTT